MTSKISALMDGELGANELGEPLTALAAEGEARDSWRTYHLISDALRGDAILSADCARRVAQRLAQEPALVAQLPHAVRAPERSRWFVPSALAASVAAVAFVGWVALGSRHAPAPAVAPLAKTTQPTPVVQSQQQAQVARVAEPPRVPLTSAAQDYLMAHQAYSPRTSLQGVAPYVRSVSDEAVQRGK
jgi:sigma-E factor negative regulatory protein RseA